MKFALIIFLFTFLCSCAPIDGIGEQPITLLVAGQSNAVGTGDSSKSPSHASNSFEYNSELDSFVPLKDPVGQFNLNFQKASTGSFTPSLVFKLSQFTDRKIFVVQCARGGSALNPLAAQKNWDNWGESGKLLGNSFIKTGKMLSKIKQQIYKKPMLNAIIWSQGENDGEAIGAELLTRAEYKKALKDLINNFRNKYGAELPFLIVETGRNTSSKASDEGYKIVREVQREVANEDDFTFIGYNETEFFEERLWLHGPVHYNQTALNDIGEKLANFIVAHHILN